MCAVVASLSHSHSIYIQILCYLVRAHFTIDGLAFLSNGCTTPTTHICIYKNQKRTSLLFASVYIARRRAIAYIGLDRDCMYCILYIV